jgi:hypothetical protein
VTEEPVLVSLFEVVPEVAPDVVVEVVAVPDVEVATVAELWDASNRNTPNVAALAATTAATALRIRLARGR